MRKLIIITLAISSLFFTACEEESTNDVSRVTQYATVEILGDAIVYIEKGTTFDEPGVNATITGEDVPYETLGTIDTNNPGFYSLTYRVINSDGFAAQAFRTIIVYENDGTLAGIWDGKRIGRSGGPILISSTGTPDTYNCSDLNAGHYEFDRALGSSFATPGVLTVAGANITSPGGANAFGNWILSAGSLAPSQTTMTWTITIPAFSFGYDCELNKITP